jgi:hypothetical protein
MIIACIYHESGLHGHKPGYCFTLFDTEKLTPQLHGDDFNQATLDEAYGIPCLTKDPKPTQEEARAALKSIYPEYKEVGWSEFEDIIGKKLENRQLEREDRARALGWQKNSTGYACIMCDGPINATDMAGLGGPHGQLDHSWYKCANCDQKYCTTHYIGYTYTDGKTPVPNEWSYCKKDLIEKDKWIVIDTPKRLPVWEAWDAILYPSKEE